MQLRIFLAVCAVAILSSFATTESQSSQPASRDQKAQGIVYHDKNKNRKYDSGDNPIPGVKVSNGREVVATNKDGRYTIPVSTDTVLFVIKPRNWRTPLSEDNLPQFFYVHKPEGSPSSKFEGVQPTGDLPDSVDFPLYPSQEPNRFNALMFGDTQARNQKEVDFIAHDVIEELVGTDASFGVTLGDIVFDDLSLFESHNRTIALLGIPWYNVIGNHDINNDAKKNTHANETFERVYGPSYYSFDHGPVHFVVVDNIEWYIESNGKGRYRGGLGVDQMQFIRNDLGMIPDDQLVVLMMHVPLTNTTDRHGLYRLIENRPFCISISGHTHHHEHQFITKADGWMGQKPHHHIINVTVCGSWWSGAKDERGIPHTTMSDGAPNGYSILSFDGTDYSLSFRAAGRPASYQMNVFAPEVVSAGALADTEILVNVFSGSTRSKVQMRVAGSEWIDMVLSPRADPQYKLMVEADKQLVAKPWLNLPAPRVSPHLWAAKLPDNVPAGTHLIHVRTTDMFGQTFESGRVIRVK